MQFAIILYAALASLVIGVEFPAVKNSQHDSIKHSQHESFNPVSPAPKIISARSDSEDFSMSGKIERQFDVVSPPPKVLPPRSDDEEFSMSGVSLPLKDDLLNDSNSATIHARKDGFIVMSPPPKVISRRFDTISPPPKTRPSESKLERRRMDIWSNGFIGNI